MACVAVRPPCSAAHFHLERPLGSSLIPPFGPNPFLMTPIGRCRPPTSSITPSITITDATPRKTLSQPLSGISTPTSSLASTSDVHTPASVAKGVEPYRLLYRGALSLPDSYLLLDGIAFSARLPPPGVPDSPSEGARELMYNPLALALESMRGRQALQFKGTVRLEEVWMDDTGEVYMDIHPFATLTRIYFENMLCLSPLVAPPCDTYGPKRTEMGVRVSLGDSDGLETTDVVIYGESSSFLQPPPLQLSSAATSTFAGPPPLSLRVARITTAPRAPRPDDPTPRQPPAHILGDTPLADLGAKKRITPRSVERSKGKERKEKEEEEDQMLRRAREVMLHLPRSRAPAGGARAKEKRARDGVHPYGQRDTVFKVPELPAKARRKQGDVGTDVFGVIEPPRSPTGNAKGRGRTAVADREKGEIGDVIEGANKLVLKKLAVHHLSKVGISRAHSEFKDIFGFVYRGASFALRSQLKTLHITAQTAESYIEAHAKMYVLSSGGAHGLSELRKKSLASSMDVDDAWG